MHTLQNCELKNKQIKNLSKTFEQSQGKCWRYFATDEQCQNWNWNSFLSWTCYFPQNKCYTLLKIVTTAAAKIPLPTSVGLQNKFFINLPGRNVSWVEILPELHNLDLEENCGFGRNTVEWTRLKLYHTEIFQNCFYRIWIYWKLSWETKLQL